MLTRKVRELRGTAEKVYITKPSRKRFDSWERNCLFAKSEEELAFWIYAVMKLMKKKFFDYKNIDPASRNAFVASRGCSCTVIGSPSNRKQQPKGKILHI